ncbi:hypothetical protein SEUBUCD646_0B03360 [Saccharomyces eubayanus]|uniref:Glucosidase 2 subunit beta n=2 Tax=Saccharomyces TaxID=4930 RepID=A0A6C1E3G5_SACPS|nr:glucosidase 2 subunit beta [Saccharomyces pastorianus]CAI1834697.1 hypothetical protein SEUBUCD650_0B03370 [Saccharomyces eubayanus]CAI1869182.1 hypothetical protein SEUBUCD646_0B03360 [Saccharomyces eubayanus]
MVSAPLLFLLLIEQAPLVFSSQQVQGNKPAHVIGVSKEKQYLYASNEPDSTKWHCLNRADIVLNLSQINDGVCDCPDGSDEPGTSACDEDIFQMVAEQSNEVNKYFYCDNKGFIPRHIRRSVVADGVCDCCDCSDELLSEYKPFDVGSDCPKLKNEFDAMASTELLGYEKGRKALLALENKYGVKPEVDDTVSSDSLEKTKQRLVDDITLLSNKHAKDKVKLDQAKRNYVDQLQIEDPVLYQFERMSMTALTSDVYSSFKVVSTVSKSHEDILKILVELSDSYTRSLNDEVVNNGIKKFKKLKRQAEKAKLTADSVIDDDQRDNLISYFTEELPQMFLERESEYSLRYVIGKSNFVKALIEGKINYTNDILQYVKEYSSIMNDISQNYNVNFQDAGVKNAVDSYKDYLSKYNTLIGHGQISPSETLSKLLNEVTSFVNENAPKILSPDANEEEHATNSNSGGALEDLRNKIWDVIPNLDQFSSRGKLITLKKQLDVYEKDFAQLDSKLQLTKAKLTAIDLTDGEQDEDNNAIVGELTKLLEGMGSQSYCIEDVLDNYSYTICFQEPMNQGTIYQIESKSSGKKVLIGRFKTLGIDADLNMNKYVEHLKRAHSDDSDLTSHLASMQEGDEKTQNYIFGNLNELDNGFVLQYENGDQCWNGPHRSATVFVRCSDTFQIRSVHEVTKCNYIFDVSGPLGCDKAFEYKPPKFNLAK